MKKLTKYLPIVTIVAALIVSVMALVIHQYSTAFAWFITAIALTIVALTGANIYGLFVTYIDSNKLSSTNMTLIQLNDLVTPDCPDNVFIPFGLTKERFEFLCNIANSELKKEQEFYTTMINISKQCVHQNELALVMYHLGFWANEITRPQIIFGSFNAKPSKDEPN